MSETAKIKKGKASAKRNSEARREQNRLASRNYREKRKQKLALLNDLLEPSNIASDVIDNVHINPAAGLDGPSDLPVTQPRDQEFPGSLQPELPSTNESLTSFDDTVPYNVPRNPNILPWTNFDGIFSHANQDPYGHDMFGLPFQFQDISGKTHVDSRLVEELFEESPESDLSSSQVSSSNNNDQALSNVMSGVENLTIEQKHTLLRRLQQDTQSPATETHIPWHQTKPPTPGQLRAVQFAKALYKTAHARPELLPMQYNMETGIFGAMFANCYALGMAGVDDILCEEGCSVFSVTQDEGHHVSQLPVVKSKFRALSPDLRPTDTQLIVGHHPYVDVIPFKTFRENLIRALENDTPIIDEGVLCHDILSGGFTCWGAGRNPHGMGAGVPWDARSWEPSVWFLMKYRQLAGDWDGELWKSARWWHSARGERMQTAEIANNPSGGTARR
ncbi:hypothetical protein FPOA_09787 [Fusarium poae]|uniref:BZIP domain-containing protein n=1 Tax=Fusarium poae TaxID=36050 RepID=A0A1B8AC70_FUSPO|nr:hypothetical protein FPOA_09787 [Fusarium poae]